MRDIEQLNAKLDDQFKVSERISDLQGTEVRAQEVIRELKDALKLQKQENAALDNLIKQKEDHLDRALKDTRQLKKRINWVTQLKQSQIRSLKGEIQNLKKSFAADFENFERDFIKQAEPILSLARQL